jgi:branched-chain amino acid transport system substrate-binding protein
MKKLSRIFGVSALVSVGLILSSCGPKQGPAESNEIKIGEYGSLTGSTATFGQSTHKGITLAARELNAAGGLMGKQVKILTEDDQGKPEQAVSAVLKLIQSDRVIAVLGEVASSRSLAAAPVCQREKIPMISPSSTSPKVTEVGDYIFRACFIDPFQGAVMAKFAYNTLGLRKAAVFTDRKQDYSVGLATYFKNTFKELGGEIVAEESYQTDDKEFKPQLTNLRSKNPDGIFIPGYYTECALIARQARELGLKIPLMGGDGWDSDVTVKSGGEAVEGAFFSSHYHPDDPRPEVQNFIEKFKRDYNGEVPDSMAVTGYDAANILFDSIRRADSLDPKLIRDHIAQTKGFSGVSGSITIDENRNAVKSAVVLKIEKGQFKFVELVSP